MMVGHTHDDVDQMFSRFSVRLKNYSKPIASLKHFFTVLGMAYNPYPRCEFMFRCMDWKSWLDKYSSHQDGSALHGHTRPHQFHFLLTEDGSAVKMNWKRWARDVVWFPANADAPPVCLLVRECCFEDFGMVEPRIPEDDEILSVKKMFAITSKYVPAEELQDQLQHLENWIAATHVEVNTFKPMSTGFKWGLTPFELSLTEAERASREDQGVVPIVTRNDIVTSDEELVYQGQLHSGRQDRVRHKNNFVDVESIMPNQFLLVRGSRNETEEVWLCKVFSVDNATRTLTVQWYGGKSIVHAQNPELAADQGSSTAGKKKRKNAVYYQDISFDTVLVSEPFSLTATKAIPRAKIKLARSRLVAMQKFSENQQN
jgi:hypothetical protein